MKLLEINYLRTYAILSIVIWHCLVCPLTCWNLIESSKITSLISILARFYIPDANMPLFTFISGYLFSYLYKKNKEKYGCFIPFLKTKFNRLVIPFLIIGTTVNITMPERYLYMIMNGEGSHLWFCMMLFWCFIIRWIILKANWKPLNFAMLIFSLMAILYSKGNNWNLPEFPLSLFGIRHAIFFYLYFVMGGTLYNNKEYLLNSMNKNKKLIYLLTILFFILVSLSLLRIRYLSFILHISTSALFIVLIYIWSLRLINDGYLRQNKYIDTLCVYSFGIYVFHEWISWGFYHQPYSFKIFEQYPIAYALVFTLLDFAASVVLTHYSLKTKVGKYLLL